MGTHSAQFRSALERGDLAELRAIWREVAPHLPQNLTDDQAAVVMHRARTEAESISLRARAYSHRYLTERGLPSGLPDPLRPTAERMFPTAVEAVGISINFRSPLLQPAATEIRGAMEGAVLEAYADNRKDPAYVSARMRDARSRVSKLLFG